MSLQHIRQVLNCRLKWRGILGPTGRLRCEETVGFKVLGNGEPLSLIENSSLKDAIYKIISLGSHDCSRTGKDNKLVGMSTVEDLPEISF